MPHDQLMKMDPITYKFPDIDEISKTRTTDY
jgi:hypothetical protein